MATGVKQQQRRALEADWVLSDYVLDEGEFGVTLDTGVIKIGDGVNGWNDLPIAFSDYYLPKLGTAANSELLEGISAASFVKVADTTAAATPGKVVLRDGEGQFKAVAGTDPTDVVNLAQMQAAISQEAVSRTVTSAITLALSDAGHMVMVNHSSTTAQVVVTIPTNASVAFPVGSWVDICAIGAGGVKFSVTGVTLNGTKNVMPSYDVLRLLKTATDTWLGIPIASKKKYPQIRVYKNAGGTSLANATDVAIPFTTVDTANTYNPDDEWFSIPGTGLPTARRVIVNKDGLYTCIYNTSVTTRNQSWAKLFKLTADNTLGNEMAAGPCFWNGQAIYHGRLTAGESIGGVFYNGTGSSTTDEADGLAGHRHDLTIIRVAD